MHQRARVDQHRDDAYSVAVGALAGLALLPPLLANVSGHWIDERITLELVARWSAWEIVTVLPTVQPHLPLWYLVPEFGGARAAVLLSLLSLPLTVVATVRLGTHFHSRPRGLLAGVIVAASPFLAVQAHWIRMYAPLTAVLTWGLWWAVDGRHQAAAAAMFLAANLHLFGVFGAVWLGGYWWRVRCLDWRRVAAVAVSGLPAVTLLAAHLVPSGGAVTTRSTGVGHAVVPGPLEIVLTPVATLVGSPHTLVQVAIALALTGMLALQWRQPALAAWVVLPVVSVAGASYVHPVFRLKYFGFIAPALAVSIATSDRPVGERALLAVLLTMGWVQRMYPVITTRRFIFWF